MARRNNRAGSESIEDEGADAGFETPEFESEVDERMEALATQGRWPLRVAASALLRADARADRLRHRRHASEEGGDAAPVPAAEPEGPALAPVQAPAPARKRAAKTKAQAEVAPAPTPSPQIKVKAKPAPTRTANPPVKAVKKAKAAPPKNESPTNAKAAARPTPNRRRSNPTSAQMQRARRNHQAQIAATPERMILEEEAWESWAEGAVDDPNVNPLAELDQQRPSEGIRARFNSALDRWAARETDTWTKADQRVFQPRKRDE